MNRTMTPERWQRVKELLGPALEMETAERNAYIERVSAGDSSLREELERHLAAHDQAGTAFLREPAQFADNFMTGSRPVMGLRIGAYLIVEEIGAGGMGEVYRAIRADDQYRKQVAIKLVRSGQDSESVIRRFRNERQILASLDHPNIACLLDGGTTEDGTPYFVMELIEGLPIDTYCDQRRLSIQERLKLFLHVCAAVQYAHQHLVIHRDIKPGNILATSDGIAKLLDFGIASILDPAAADIQLETTQTIHRPLTPGYASPEQVTAGIITTASDVYSLGVVLYELLAGRSPYRLTDHTRQEIERVVCVIDPEPPSLAVGRPQPEQDDHRPHTVIPAQIAEARQASPEKLKKLLEGDLDNIVLMALRKEPQRRYNSVEQFARDIERHLDNLPVRARKNTFGYQASKFLYRHRAGVAVVAVFICLLLTAVTVTLWEAHIARHQAEIAQAQRARAERRFNDVRKLANSLIFDLHDPIRDLPGSTPVLEKLIDTSLQYLDSLAREAEGDVSLQRELASAYKRLGDAKGMPVSGQNLGDSTGALASYRKALQLREMLVKSDPLNLMDQIDLAATHRMIGGLLLETGDLHAGREQLDRALKIAESIANAHTDNVEAVRELSADLTIRGEFESADRSLALPYHRRSLEVVCQLARLQPAEQRWQRSIAYEAGRVAFDLALSGRPKEAIDYARQALRRLEQLSKTRQGALNSGLTSQLMATHYQLANAWLLDGNPGDAVRDFRAALSYGQSLSSADPKNVQVQLDVGNLYIDLGLALADHDRARAGLTNIVKGLGILEQQSVADPLRSDTVHDLADGYVYMGQVLEKMGDLAGALVAYDKARKLLESPAVSDRINSAGVNIAAIRVKAAKVLVQLGRFKQAHDEYQRALPAVEAANAVPVNTLAQYVAADLYAALGDLAVKSPEQMSQPPGGNREVCKWYSKSHEMWQQLPLKKGLAPNWFEVAMPEQVSDKLRACKG